jgi:hypothetical protein
MIRILRLILTHTGIRTETGIIKCIQPLNHVLDNTDCNDSDPAINPDTYWYQDGDGDNYGNASVSLQQCIQPLNHVLDNTDCNDSDPAINPDTYWYQDGDEDGYGNPAISLQQCSQPMNGQYLLDNTDCDDGDPNIYPGGPDVRISGVTTTYHATLQDAYDTAAENDAIQSRDAIISEDLFIDLDKTVTFLGGYDCDYTAVSGITTISGDVTVSNGSVAMENINIQ